MMQPADTQKRMKTKQTNTMRRHASIATLALGATLLAAPTAKPADSIYVSYTAGNYAIERFRPDGVGSVFASTGLNAPTGLAFDGAGNLYAANYGNNTIERFTPGGVGSVFASTGLIKPEGLAFDRAGNLYVANVGSYSGQRNHSFIEKFTPDGIGSVFANTGLNTP